VNFHGNGPVDIEDFLAGLRSSEKPISLKTLRVEKRRRSSARVRARS
jgi:hypothetical protein